MARPNEEPYEPNPLLPVVSTDTYEAVVAEVMTDPSYIDDSFKVMQKENPNLEYALSNLIRTFTDDAAVTRRLRMLSSVIYRSLHAQAEANVMNEQFGYVNPNE